METHDQTTNVDWELLAYHEAGHAVLATVLGFKADLISLGNAYVPGNTLRTRTEYSGPKVTSPEAIAKSMYGRATYLISGRLAEFKGTGRRFEEGWVADDLQIDWWYEMLDDIMGATRPPQDDFLRTVESRAESLLAEHWPIVQLVADELRRSREIDGHRLREIVTPASQHKG